MIVSIKIFEQYKRNARSIFIESTMWRKENNKESHDLLVL